MNLQLSHCRPLPLMLRPMAVFCIRLTLWPCAAAQSAKTPKPTLKEHLILLSAGSVVEVSLKNNEKLRAGWVPSATRASTSDM